MFICCATRKINTKNNIFASALTVRHPSVHIILYIYINNIGPGQLESGLRYNSYDKGKLYASTMISIYEFIFKYPAD